MNILIVEDDPMVEFIHRNYLEKGGQFKEIFSANSVSSAEKLLREKEIALILLDIHLKDGNGLGLLEEIRKERQTTEVILITAASEAKTVKEGLHLGVVDYLIKPFTNERFQQSISLFFKRKNALNQANVQQETIDQLIKGQDNQEPTEIDPAKELVKGLSIETLDHVKATIQGIHQPFTIQELADKSELSHVSIRKYIAYLEENQYVRNEVIYTKVGRPYKAYYKC